MVEKRGGVGGELKRDRSWLNEDERKAPLMVEDDILWDGKLLKFVIRSIQVSVEFWLKWVDVGCP